MSLSLSQKLDSSVKVRERLAVSYGVTDEIFAVASSKPGTIGGTLYVWINTSSCIGVGRRNFLQEQRQARFFLLR